MINHQKYTNAIFIAAGAVIWFILRHYTGEAISFFQLSRKMGSGASDLMYHGLPILAGLGTWFGLRTWTLSYNFVSDSVTELVRVSWPTTKDVRLGTIVVIITVLIAGVILGILDLGLTQLVKFFVGA